MTVDGECEDCYFWPQSRRGSYSDVPFVTVGATYAPDRTRASYSNYGACVNVFANGSVVCALDVDKSTGAWWIGINGTSFSTPLFASILALQYSQSLDSTGDEIVAKVLADATTDITLDDGNTYKYALVTSDMRAAGADVSAYDGGLGTAASALVATSISSQLGDWWDGLSRNTRISIICGIALFFVFLAMFLRKVVFRRREAQPLTRSAVQNARFESGPRRRGAAMHR